MFRNGDMKIEHVSFKERVKMCCLALLYGWYLILRSLLKWAYNPKHFFFLQPRGNPPKCLVDNTFGNHSYVKLKGIKFHYVEAGDREKPLLLLLHGFPDCWLSWREQFTVLSGHYRVVALDLKGFGDSDKPLNKSSYKLEILIDELKQFILALGANTCNIIGHDLGGLLGWYMAALHDDIIYKFIAISSPHPNIYWRSMTGESVFSNRWVHFSRLPFFPEIDALKEDLSVINHTYKHVKKYATGNNYVEAYKYAFSRKEDWTGPINYFRNLPYTRLNMNNKQIRTKTLLIIGNADPCTCLETIVQSTEFVEKINVKIISAAGHFPHQERPGAVNEAIIKFLLGNPAAILEPKAPSKGIVSSWLGSINTTMRYGNQIIDAVQKKTNGVVTGLPSKVLYLGQTTS